MNKRLLSTLLALCMVLAMLPPVTITARAADDGIPYYAEAPAGGSYTISSPKQLQELAETVNEGEDYAGTFFKLAADIDLSKIDDDEDGQSWTPIGDNAHPFRGTFDGGDGDDNNFEITGLYIHSVEGCYQGLFGCVGMEGTVQNVNVSGEITGKSYVGGVAGSNSGTVTNCHNTDNTGHVEGDSYVGGVVGSNSGKVTNCSNASDVKGDSYVGGVVGYNTGDTIEKCDNSGKIEGNGKGCYVGGVVGSNSGTVTNCHNTGNIDGTGYVGGVVGLNIFNTVANCGNSGSVKSNGESCYVGGVVGCNTGNTIKDCDNSGNVESNGEGCYAGGVVGSNTTGNTIQDCDNSGSVKSNGENCNVGGVVGCNTYSTVVNCGNSDSVESNGENCCVGGVVGFSADGRVQNCFNTHPVTGSGKVGGVVGENSRTVTDCYNTGDLTVKSEGPADTGGVVGNNSQNGVVENCYSTGILSVEPKGGANTGGVVGWSTGTVTNCYYKDATAGQGIGPGSNASASDKVESKSEEAFASGEVAWLLQDGRDTQVWGQLLTDKDADTPKDTAPVLTSDSVKKVLKVTFISKFVEVGAAYANTGGTVNPPETPNPDKGWYTAGDEQWIFASLTVQADMTLTAKWQQEKYSVFVSKTGDGDVEVSVAADPDEAGAAIALADLEQAGKDIEAEAKVTLTVTPADGCRLQSAPTAIDETGKAVSVSDGEAVEEEDAENTKKYTFTMPESDVKVTVAFERVYTVTVEGTENGTVTADKEEAAAGEVVTLTVIPDDDYELDTLTVTDGNKAPITVTNNAFTMPENNVKVTATFKQIPVAAESVTLDRATLSMTEGDTDTLTATVTPADAGTVSWSVTPSDIVSLIPSGNTVTIKAVSAGTATIEASSGNKKATCAVTVTAQPADNINITVMKASDSITIMTPTGSEYKYAITIMTPTGSEYEYAIENEAWQDSPQFTGLSDQTTYKVRACMKDSNTLYASAARAQVKSSDASAASGVAEKDVTTTASDGSTILKSGETVETKDGGSITNDGKQIIMNDGSGNITTATPVPTDGAKVDGNGNVEVPGGSTVKPPEGPDIIIGDKGGSVSISGSVTLPEGGSARIGDTTVTIPKGGTITPNGDGTVSIPSDSQVKDKDGKESTVPKDGGKIGADGVYTANTSGSTDESDSDKSDTVGYTITFNANGGTLSSTTAKTGTDGKLSSLPTPTRSGYRFIGWYTAAEGGSEITTATVFTKDTTIYAHWTKAAAGDYFISLYIIPTAGGSVTGGGYYNKGASVSVRAIPASGYRFAGWTEYGVVVSTSTVYTFTATMNRALTAEFESISTSSANSTSSTSRTNSSSGSAASTTRQSSSTSSAASSGNTPAASAPAALPAMSFHDVSSANWFYTPVQYVYSRGLMTGDGGPSVFNPRSNMTRVMVWTVLGRMAGADIESSSTPPWYSKVQDWAVANYVSDGTKPTNSVSRQELMTMLWRYSGSPSSAADLRSFRDYKAVAGWADSAMQWGVSTGLIVGDNGRLNPAGNAKRCEVAAIIMRYCEKNR